MEHKKPGFWFFFKEIFGYLFMTVFSLCLAIGMKNSGADVGFILFAAAATAVGLFMTLSTLKKAVSRGPYVPEAEYQPGVWLRELDNAKKDLRPCPNCGSLISKQEDYCVKCKSVIPAEPEVLPADSAKNND